MERIVGSAVFYKGAIISLPRPARHGAVLDAAHTMGLGVEVGYHQGFTTSEGRFVERDQALVIAERAKQLIGEPTSAKDLFSEDVW